MKLEQSQNIKTIPKKQQFIKNTQGIPLLLMIIPGLLYFIIFNYIPMAGVVIAFKDYKLTEGIFGSKWVGLENFLLLFRGNEFGTALKNTILISGYKLIFGFPAAIILALLLNEIRSKTYKNFVQTVSYLPHFMSWIVVSGLIISILSPNTGVVNHLIKLLGFKPIFFMSDPKVFRGVLVVTDIWKNVGWNSVLYLAALSSIDNEMYEAATVDGANRWHKVWYLTLPSIVPVISITLILNVGFIMNAGFDQIFNMYSPNVYKVSDIIDTYVYKQGMINFMYSYSTAVGLFKSVVGLILILITNAITKRLKAIDASTYGLW